MDEDAWYFVRERGKSKRSAPAVSPRAGIAEIASHQPFRHNNHVRGKHSLHLHYTCTLEARRVPEQKRVLYYMIAAYDLHIWRGIQP